MASQRLLFLLTLSQELHGYDPSTGHEVGQLLIEGLPLVNTIEPLCIRLAQVAHLQVAACQKQKSRGRPKGTQSYVV